MQHQAHVMKFLEAKFGLYVWQSHSGTVFAYDTPDEDYDSSKGYDDTYAFAAAMDYASCYDGAMFDRLDAMQG